jgi:hydroxymethylpyrimidine/phosphomethylpyrimidine kinase
MKRVLAVGGSDSSGGAGIQADVKTLHTLGVHAATVVTAVTAQSSLAVTDVYDLPEASIRAQLAAVLDDLGADLVKTGMLSTPEAVVAVAEALDGRPLVVDPVGVSSTGRSLLRPEALAVLRSHLLPLATVVTPNLAEVAALTGLQVRDTEDLESAARAVHALGPQWVLVKGGHLPGPPTDLLYDGRAAVLLEGPRVATEHTHGTGCTLAAALSAYLARGEEVPSAARQAKAFVTDALRHAYPMGAGAGTLHQR